MSRSQRLSMMEMRSAFRLIGELRELGGDTDTWRRHMLVELLRLIGGQVGLGHELPLNVDPTCLHQFVGWVDVGWQTQREAKWFREIMDKPILEDPAIMRYISMLRPQSVTCLLEDLADPDEWRATQYFDEVRRPGNVDSFINTGCILTSAGCVHGMCLLRAIGETPFTRREQKLVQLFHEELCHLWQQPAAPDPIDALAPRQQQIVARFRAGDSEKQIAYRLGLSRQTVHAYVKSLYKRVGVSGRFELLQRLAPPAPSFRVRLSVEDHQTASVRARELPN